jgi:hypothetical protein
VKLLRISTGDRLFYFTSAANGGYQFINSALVVSKNAWHVVAISARGDSGVFFLDGVFSGPMALGAVSATPSSAVPIYLCRNTRAVQPTQDPFFGSIDRCAVYNKGLSNTEIYNIFNGMRGRYGI